MRETLRGSVAGTDLFPKSGGRRTVRASQLEGGSAHPRPTLGYQNALLGEDYMQGFVDQTTHLYAKRKRKLRRYIMLDRIMFWSLCMWGILGLLIAFYKTALQPDRSYSAETMVDDVDVVVMLDASRHMRYQMKQQHAAAMNFTWGLDGAVAEYVTRAYAKAFHSIAQRKAEYGGVHRLPVLSWFAPAIPDRVRHSGGNLRTRFGSFNVGEPYMHQLFTANVSQIEEDLKAVDPESYVEYARLMTALESCEAAMPVPEEVTSEVNGPGRKRYCILFADNEAICDKHDTSQVDLICQQWKHLCPPSATRESNLLEFGHELHQCADASRRLHANNDIEVLLMITSGSEKESQLRLKSKAFREFVESTTECSFNEFVTNVSSAHGHFRTISHFDIDDDCVRFILAKDFEELQEKSGRLAELLKAREIIGESVLTKKDYRFLWFILLALLPLFYIGWSRIITAYAQVESTVKSKIGVATTKKKMVKVTKKLVEKDRKTVVIPPVVQTAGQEVEMAEMAPSRPGVQFGDSLTLRARLKGGYLRENVDDGVADGHGHAFGSDAYWTFEPVDAAATGSETAGRMKQLQRGQRVRIRGADGKLLIASSNATGFVDPTSGDAQGDDTIFEAELVESETQGGCCLGDILRLKNCGTGRYLRVHKDGRCDADGLSAEAETQLVIDRGGLALQSGSVIHVTALATRQAMRVNSRGQVDATPNTAAHTQYWFIEKKSSAEGGERGSAESGDDDAIGEPLKHGDVVTLKAISQNLLEVDSTGRLRAGGSPSAKSANGDADSTAPAWTEQESVFDFVVERAGLLTGKSKDKTIRIGGEVILKPLLPARSDVPLVKTNATGQLWADGNNADAEAVTFKLDGASLPRMISPLAGAMAAGDTTLHLQALWDKHAVSNVDACSAPWNTGNDLKAFVGHVVLASPSGQYAIPKPTKGGAAEGWVAVVQEGIDLKKAAQQAKAQGATGLIVRCQDEVSLAKLAKAAQGEKPELPAVFVGGPSAATFDERGLVLVKPDCKSKELSVAMRTIAANSGKKGPKTTGAIFTAVGDALVAMGAGKITSGEEKDDEEIGQVTEAQAGNYKWKVTSNTQYLWSKSGGGGAAMMKVNYGKVAPPSAQQKKRVDEEGREVDGVDASLTHNNLKPNLAAGLHLDETGAVVPRLSLINEEDEQAHRLDEEISKVLPANVAHSFAREQLEDESDFQIEYDIGEVEVDPDAAGEDLADEDELLDHEGDEVERLAVPMNVFWMLVVGMVVFTFLLFFFLYRVMRRDLEVEDGGYIAPSPSQVMNEAVRVASERFMMPQQNIVNN